MSLLIFIWLKRRKNEKFGGNNIIMDIFNIDEAKKKVVDGLVNSNSADTLKFFANKLGEIVENNKCSSDKSDEFYSALGCVRDLMNYYANEVEEAM